MNEWLAPARPRAHAESVLLAAILDGTFPPGTTVLIGREPGSDELVKQEKFSTTYTPSDTVICTNPRADG